MNLIKIPRNIFQTWESKNISSEFDILTQTWKYKNPNYAYFLFDSNDREEFIKQNFDENIYKSYCRIIPGAFKADLWRYCILFIYGGVYVDIDTICLNNIDNFLDESNYETLKNIISTNSLFGKVILEVLVKRAFHPNKMNKSINKYSYYL